MTLSFSQEPAPEFTPDLGLSLSGAEGWLPLIEQPLLILVGVTGVGKSTVTAALAQAGLVMSHLANRRVLTDLFIIPTIVRLEAREDRSGNPSCRVKRFYYTRRYKELFPAGMVHVLSQLQVNPRQVPPPFLFDGLRGEQEVQHAVQLLPQARFIVLEAPDYVRLQRLLIRQDAFDRVAPYCTLIQSKENQCQSFAELGVPEAAELFSSDELTEMLSNVEQGLYSLSYLRDRLKIVIEERRHYDPDATRLTLERLAPDRTLAIDTTCYSPEAIARKVIQFCGTENSGQTSAILSKGPIDSSPKF